MTGLFSFLSPSLQSLILFGASGAIPVFGFGRWWTVLSAAWLHGGLLHIAFNGYALYIVGGVVEQELGRWRFAVLYAVTGFCASVASYAIGSPLEPSVGASGAIFGLFGVFFAYNYQRRHLAFYAARMRSMGTLILINLVLTFTIPQIDWRGHVGGLTTGIIGGLAVDGFGRRTSRTQVFVGTMVAFAALAVALTVWRTAVIRSQFPEVFG